MIASRGFYTCLVLSFLLVGCTAGEPAVVERKESLYHGKSGIIKLITVQQGQSLEYIAAENNTSVTAIAEANDLHPPYKLLPDQVLKVPVINPSQFEEELYNASHHHSGIEELPLVDAGEVHTSDAYHSDSASGAAVLGGGYLGSITGSVDDAMVKREKEAGAPIAEESVHIAENSGIAAATPSVPDSASHGSDTFKLATPLGSSAFIWPVQGEVNSRYGKSGEKFNEGMNITAPKGAAVKAVAAGTVLYTGKEPKVYGNLIIIKHKDGYLSAYAHNDVILVKKGAHVQQGDIIAKVGSSGAVSTPQLHFSMRKDKKTMNPEHKE